MPDAFHVLHNGALVVGEDGRVRPGEPSNSNEETELGDVVLLPGLVNAHAHLELSELSVAPAASFEEWIGGVLGARASLDDGDYRGAVQQGARRLLATGTTAVGDLDSSGASEGHLGQAPLRSRIYRELLDADDPQRTEEQLLRLHGPRERGGEALRGIAPHAPHTVSDDLLRACASESLRADEPISIHWAETRAECDWLSGGTGPFSSFLSDSPRCSGLERLLRAGLLERPFSLVHGNHPEPGDLERIAAAGGTLVHCPGSHAYFGRDPVDLEQWLIAGVSIALGTDSMASNEDLDMRREMAILRRTHPTLEPASVLDWATRGGARALDLANEIGDLRAGKWADFIALDASGLDREADVLEGITAGELELRGVWIGGLPVSL